MKKIFKWFSLTSLCLILSARADSYNNNIATICGLIFASVIWGIIIRYKENWIECEFAGNSRVISVISVLGSMIWVWNALAFFVERNGNFIRDIAEKLRVNENWGQRTIATILFFASFYGAFIILRKLISTCYFAALSFIKTSDNAEKYYLLLWSVLCCLFVAIVYFFSTAFYSGGAYNILYTFDSNTIYNCNTFMLIGQKENDIRQSLFAFFSLPVSIPAWFLSVILPFKYSYAFFLQIFQDILLGVGIVLLSRMIGVSQKRKPFVLLFLSVMCESLFFSLLMEQYIILVFWLIVTLYGIVNNVGSKEFCAVATVGTAPTSFLLLFWEWKNRKTFMDFVIYGLKSALIYACALICLGQFGLLIHVFDNIAALGSYAKAVELGDRIRQYLYFLRSCFLGPSSYITTWDGWEGGPVLRMSEVCGWSRVGILILIAIVVSWFINRKKLFANICLSWVAFSVLLLAVIGFDSSTNDFFLFAHYFGWALAALLLMGLSRLIKKDRPFIIAVLLATVVLLVYNCRYLYSVISFAITYYPVT